jgi:hypothetical protein
MNNNTVIIFLGLRERVSLSCLYSWGTASQLETLLPVFILPLTEE